VLSLSGLLRGARDLGQAEALACDVGEVDKVRRPCKVLGLCSVAGWSHSQTIVPQNVSNTESAAEVAGLIMIGRELHV